MTSAPGKAHRKGIGVMEVARMFATEEAAVQWFEDWHWPTGEMACMRCGSLNAYRVTSGKPMPYRCRDCRKYFSLKTGTAMEDSKLPLRMWGWAIYLEITSLKGVSAMKLHRDLGISYPSAWFLLHRIREAFAGVAPTFDGPGEVDECDVGGKRKNMSNAKRKELAGTGRGPVGKTAVGGMKDRETGQVAAKVIDRTDSETLQGFVDAHAGIDPQPAGTPGPRLPTVSRESAPVASCSAGGGASLPALESPETRLSTDSNASPSPPPPPPTPPESPPHPPPAPAASPR